MAVAGQFLSGKGGRAQIDAAVNLAMQVWSTDDKGADLKTTNFNSFVTTQGTTGDPAGGRSFEQGLIGIESCAWAITGDWDSAENPLQDPPGLYIRDDGPQIDLYPNQTLNFLYSFPMTRVISAATKTDVNGKVTFDCKGMNQGPYFRLGETS